MCDGGAARADEPLFKWSEKKMGDPREPRRVAERERAREGGRVYIIIMSEQVEVLKRALSLCTTRILLTTRQGGKKWFEKSWANEKDSDVMLRQDAFGFMPHDH